MSESSLYRGQLEGMPSKESDARHSPRSLRSSKLHLVPPETFNPVSRHIEEIEKGHKDDRLGSSVSSGKKSEAAK